MYFEFRRKLKSLEEKRARKKLDVRPITSVGGGGIRIACNSQETVVWLKEIVEGMEPVEGKSGYTVYLPGEEPFKRFKIKVTDEKMTKDFQRFVEVVETYNPTIDVGTVKVISVLKPFVVERGGAILLIMVRSTLLPKLEELGFELNLGFKSAKLHPIWDGSPESEAEGAVGQDRNSMESDLME